MFTRVLLGRTGPLRRVVLRPRQQQQQAAPRRFFADEAKAAKVEEAAAEAVKESAGAAAPAGGGGPSPMLIGGALAVVGIGGYMAMGGTSEKPAAKTEVPATKTEALATKTAATQSSSVEWGLPLGDTTEEEVLADLRKLAGRLDGVEGSVTKVVEVHQRIVRLEQHLLGDSPSVDAAAVAALAGRVSAAEAALQTRSAPAGDAELEDPQVIAALELLAAKLAKLEQKAMGK
jgi:hypothetical protein